MSGKTSSEEAKKPLPFWEWQELITKAPIPDGLKLTYIALRNFDGKNGCHPKLATVAERRGLSVNTVQRHITALRRHRYLFSQQSRGPNRYWFTNTEGSPGAYKEHDLLLYEPEPIEQINYTTPKDGVVSNGAARNTTPRDGVANYTTPKDGVSEVAVKEHLNTRKTYDITETRQRPALVAQTENGNDETAPVNGLQQTANDNGWRDGKGPTKLFSQANGKGATEEEVQELAALLQERGAGSSYADNTPEKQARNLLAIHDLAECKAALGDTIAEKGRRP